LLKDLLENLPWIESLYTFTVEKLNTDNLKYNGSSINYMLGAWKRISDLYLECSETEIGKGLATCFEGIFNKYIEIVVTSGDTETLRSSVTMYEMLEHLPTLARVNYE
jgi:hypothetical protein